MGSNTGVIMAAGLFSYIDQLSVDVCAERKRNDLR